MFVEQDYSKLKHVFPLPHLSWFPTIVPSPETAPPGASHLSKSLPVVGTPLNLKSLEAVLFFQERPARSAGLTFKHRDCPPNGGVSVCFGSPFLLNTLKRN